MTAQVRLEVDGPIASIVLARPEVRNAMTERMGNELGAAIAALDARTGVRAVVVRGEGKAFSAGGDLGFIEARLAASADDNFRTMRAFYPLFLAIRKVRVPTIAAIHGSAIGAGACFSLACDFRLAATGTQIGFNFVRLGLHPGMGASLLLPRLVGVARATELLLTGKTIDADEAHRIGLVHSVHAADALVAASITLAHEISAGAPRAVAATVAALRGYDAAELDAYLDREAREQAIDYGSGDVAEGVRAARERRSPAWNFSAPEGSPAPKGPAGAK